MGVTVSIDAAEVRTLSADMRMIDARLSRYVRPVVEKGANNIKTDMRDAASKSRHFKFAPTIGYDVEVESGHFEAKVGPELGGAGSLAGIAYFGGVRGGGGTVEDPQAALDREAPRFEKALADLAAELVF